MSERPGRLVDEIKVDLPNRDNPMSRMGSPLAKQYVDHLMATLHLEEKAA